MSKTDLHETAYLKLVFQNVGFANIGDATGLRGSTTPGNFYIGLFTAVTDGEAGTVTEVTTTQYTNYARQPIARSTAGFGSIDNYVYNLNQITFPIVSGGTGCTVTHFGIYTAVTGGTLIGYGTLTNSVTVSTSATPKLISGALTIYEGDIPFSTPVYQINMSELGADSEFEVCALLVDGTRYTDTQFVPVTGDTIYTNTAGAVFNGNNKWYMFDFLKYRQVNTVGVVIAEGVCEGLPG